MTTHSRGRLVAFALLLACSVPALAQTYARTRLFTAAGRGLGSAEISPNGRWLAFDLAENEAQSALWIQPLAGGDPIRITSPGQYDANPQWSPRGDRIFFMSTRPARSEPRKSYVMSMPLDIATGRPAGPPRQVTLDAVISFRLSPDSQLLAYVSDAKPEYLLRVLSASGGTARTLVTLELPVRSLSFAPDSRYVFYATRPRGSLARSVMRVGVGGGVPESVMRSQKSIIQVTPNGRHAVLWATGPGQRDRWFEIVSFDGKLVARIPADREMNLSGFSPDGRALVVTQSDVAAPTRVMPVAGGAYRQITEPEGYDWVAGWSADSRTVYTLTESGGPALTIQPLDGGQPRKIPGIGATENAQWYSSGPGITVFAQPARERELQRLIGLDMATNRRTVLSERVKPLPAQWAVGPGGVTRMNGDEVLYFESKNARLELRAARLDGTTRLLRAVPDTLRFGYFAVHGTRVAWSQPNSEGGIDLMLANGPSAPPRRLLRAGKFGELAFSPDGRWIGLVYPTATAPGALAIVDPNLTDQSQPARILDTGALYAYWLRWLPDNSALLAIGGTAGTKTDVIMVPLREGDRAVAITRDDPSPKWGFEISPDGRYIAYPGEIWRGSAIWRIELNGALTTTRK